MENAVEALKMAFAVIVFVIALSVTMVSFSVARVTSQAVLYAEDKTNYYDYQEASGKAKENRIVGLETIIPTVYKYDKERYKVIFKKGNYDETTGNFSGDLKNLEIYRTTTNSSLWNKDYKNEYDSFNPKSLSICSFDTTEETLRKEPWVGNPDNIRNNLDAFMQGGRYVKPSYAVGDTDSSHYVDYKKFGFIKKYSGKRFLEMIGEEETSDTDASGVTNKGTKKIITYILID